MKPPEDEDRKPKQVVAALSLDIVQITIRSEGIVSLGEILQDVPAEKL